MNTRCGLSRLAGKPRIAPVVEPLRPHEGQQFDQEFSLLANPPVPNEQLVWTRNGAPFAAPVAPSQLRPYRNRLRSPSVHRSDSGNYTLNASNAIGSSLLHVEIIVQCTVFLQTFSYPYPNPNRTARYRSTSAQRRASSSDLTSH